MARDIVYFYDKETFEKHELGEIQTNFNVGFGVDGSKDSAKIIVYGFMEKVVEPYTIIYHPKTRNWWCVSSDRVERYQNESRFLYKHELQLVGVFELLNARDLTDSGYYQNNYTFREFIERLFKLSTCEFPIAIYDNDLVDLNQKVDYIKTFENYTLASALREFLDGYNLCAKVSFVEINNKLSVLHLMIYSKTGDPYSTFDYSDLTDSREIKSMNKNSFGTNVVSNAENVVSTKEKIYPTTGYAKLSGTDYVLTPDTALLRLPSNIYRVNWMKIYLPKISIKCRIDYAEGTNRIITLSFDPTSKTSFDIAWNKIIEFANTERSPYKETIINELNNKKQVIFDSYERASRITLYTGWRYDPVSRQFIAPSDNSDFYFPQIRYLDGATSQDELYNGKLVFGEQEEVENTQYKQYYPYYVRGENVIRNFHFTHSLGDGTNKRTVVDSFLSTDYRNSNTKIFEVITIQGSPNRGMTIDLDNQELLTKSNSLDVSEIKVKINYIPMSDIKIKLDNTCYTRDTQLYNQNGKLTDSVGLSKLLNSYSKEIQSDSITRYANYYSYDSVPVAGSRTFIGNDIYVLSNISTDCTPHENDNYYCSCELTLSKYIATKTVMTNPNTNIRDYGIPQNNNVVRKQLYRDFYELDKTVDPKADNDFYMPLRSVFNLTSKYSSLNEHIAVMKMTFDRAYGGNGSDVEAKNTYYYQLDTTTYVLKKSLYEVVNFKDNNIIGYGSQNVSCGFDIRRVFTGLTDTINTPISYVDDNGKVKGIDICFCTNEQITNIYEKYVERKKEEYGYPDFDKSIYNYSVFIDSEIFEGVNGEDGALQDNDFIISESEYNKDPIEVPFFEYSLQVDDTDNVIIGDNILDNKESDKLYIYQYALFPKGYIDNNNFGLADLPNVSFNMFTRSYDGDDIVKCEYNGNSELILNFYENTNIVDNVETLGNRVNKSDLDLANNDLIVIRSAYIGIKRTGMVLEPTFVKDLMLVVRNGNQFETSENNGLVMKINHYKVN